MSLRPATIADTDDIIRVIKAVYDEYGFAWEPEGYHADLYDLHAAYFVHGDEFFVGLDGEGNVQATAVLERFPTLPGMPGSLTIFEEEVRIGAADCAINRLYVHPDARRLGQGRRLTQHVIDRSKEQGCKLMEIWSDKLFTSAHQLYQALGAEVIGERICDCPERSPEWGMMLKL